MSQRARVAASRFSALRSFIHQLRRDFVCDSRAVASCVTASICIRVPGSSSPFFFRLSLLLPLLYFVSSFPGLPLFCPATWTRLEDGLIRSDLYFSLSLVSFVCTSHFRTLERTRLRPSPLPSLSFSIFFPPVPIKSAGIVFKLARAFASSFAARLARVLASFTPRSSVARILAY